MKLRRFSLVLTLVSVLTLTPILAGSASAAGNAPAGAPGRYIVIFDTGVNQAAKQTLVGQFNGVVERQIALLGNANVVFLPPAAIQQFAGNAGVVRVDEDVTVYATGKPSGKPSGGKPKAPPPEQSVPWGVDRIDADLAWGTSTGAGVRVAVIDTGIDLNHPDLQANIKGNVNIINPAKSADDDNGHGTHVAGTIAAVDNTIGVKGVAPEAHLYAVKVLSRNGSGFLSDVISGIEWAINNNMQVINMSLGTSSDIQSQHDAVDAAYAAGIVVVAAAGNSGDGDPDNDVNYPARYSSVIAVAATDSADNRASWSSDGPEVEIAAPGVSIPSTWKGGGYKTISGTSMASPHVAATAALVIASGRASTPGDVRAILSSTADDLGAAGQDYLYGNGLVDAQEAATGVQTLP